MECLVALGAERLAARRNVVIDAAEHLIRKTRSTDFTMVEIARYAGVSPGTPYNLFETKAGVLYALLSRSMDGIEAAGMQAGSEHDPLDRIGASAAAAARFYTADPAFYRALYRFLLGVEDPVHRPAIMGRAFAYWDRATQGLADRRLFPAEFAQQEFAFQLTTNFLGITDLWVHGELDDRQYVARVAHGATSLLLGLVKGADHKRLLQTLGRMRAQWASPTSVITAGAPTVSPLDRSPRTRSKPAPRGAVTRERSTGPARPSRRRG